MSALRIAGVRKPFGAQVLKGIDIEVDSGEFSSWSALRLR